MKCSEKIVMETTNTKKQLVNIIDNLQKENDGLKKEWKLNKWKGKSG